MGYVGEGSAVDKRRCVLRRLHQVRVNRIVQDSDDCARHAKIFYRQRLSIKRHAEHNVFYAALQVSFVFCQTENRHNF